MNSIEEQTSTTEKLLDSNKRSKTRKEVRNAFTTLELFNAHDFYDNVLIPQGERFAAQLEQLQENIAHNRQTL